MNGRFSTARIDVCSKLIIMIYYISIIEAQKRTKLPIIKTAIATPGAPSAIGPYSQAIYVGNFLFTSGQIPVDPATGHLIDGGIHKQCVRVMENLKAVLFAAGVDFCHVVKTTVFLKDMHYFSAMNDVYARYFESTNVAFPSRSTVQVAALPKGALIEIDCVAFKEVSG